MKAIKDNFLLYIIIALLAWKVLFTTESVQPDKKQVLVEEKQGTTGNIQVEKSAPTIIYMKNEKQTVVDDIYKRKYENAIDSLEKQELYYKAIQLREYKKKVVDNDTIEINATVKTRGSLLDYKIDYKIKESVFEYTPEVIKEMPSLSVELGTEVGVSTTLQKTPILKGNIGIINRKGIGFNVGYDTEKTVWVGVKKTFKLLN